MIAGSYNDAYTINYGYLRSADGTITVLTAPGAGSGFKPTRRCGHGQNCLSHAPHARLV